MERRQLPAGVIQICCMQPGPLISASVKVAPAFISTEGGNLPTLAQVAGRALARARGGHGGFALFAGEVFRADRTRLGLGDAVEVAEVEIKAVKRGIRRECARDAKPDGGGEQGEKVDKLLHNMAFRIRYWTNRLLARASRPREEDGLFLVEDQLRRKPGLARAVASSWQRNEGNGPCITGHGPVLVRERSDVDCVRY